MSYNGGIRKEPTADEKILILKGEVERLKEYIKQIRKDIIIISKGGRLDYE